MCVFLLKYCFKYGLDIFFKLAALTVSLVAAIKSSSMQMLGHTGETGFSADLIPQFAIVVKGFDLPIGIKYYSSIVGQLLLRMRQTTGNTYSTSLLKVTKKRERFFISSYNIVPAHVFNAVHVFFF